MFINLYAACTQAYPLANRLRLIKNRLAITRRIRDRHISIDIHCWNNKKHFCVKSDGEQKSPSLNTMSKKIVCHHAEILTLCNLYISFSFHVIYFKKAGVLITNILDLYTFIHTVRECDYYYISIQYQ